MIDENLISDYNRLRIVNRKKGTHNNNDVIEFFNKYKQRFKLKFYEERQFFLEIETGEEFDFHIFFSSEDNNRYHGILPFSLDYIETENISFLENFFDFVGEYYYGDFKLQETPEFSKENDKWVLTKKGSIKFTLSKERNKLEPKINEYISSIPEFGTNLIVYAEVNKVYFSLKNISSNNIVIKSIKSADFEFQEDFQTTTIIPNESKDFTLAIKNPSKNFGKIVIENNLQLKLYYYLKIEQKPNFELDIPEAIKKDNIFYIEYNKNISEYDKGFLVNLKIDKGSDYIKNLKISPTELFLVGNYIKNQEISKESNFSFIIKANHNITEKSNLKLTFDFKYSEIIKSDLKIQFIKKSLLERDSTNTVLKEYLLSKSNNFEYSINYKSEKQNLEIKKVFFKNKTCNWIEYLRYIKKNNLYELIFEIKPSLFPQEKEGILIEKFEIHYVNEYGILSQVEDEIHIPITKTQNLKGPLVIDFGTTNSCVAWVSNEKNDSKIKILEFEENNSTFEDSPTLLFFRKFKSSINLNEDILSDKQSYNTIFNLDIFNHSVWGWKKFFGEERKYTKKGYTDTLGYMEEFDVINLTKIYLKKIIDSFTLKTNLTPVEFAFTYPTNYESKKLVLNQAMEEIGYSNCSEIILNEINEPNALAYYFATNNEKYNFFQKENLKLNEPIIYSIFDFGGGTTDITIAKLEKIEVDEKTKIIFPDGSIEEEIIKKEKVIINILDTGAPPNVGGDYLDFEIGMLIKKELEKNNASIEILYPKDIHELFLSSDPKIRENVSNILKDARLNIKHNYNHNIKNKVNGTNDKYEIAVSKIHYKKSNDLYFEKLSSYSVSRKSLDDVINNHIKKGFDFLNRMIQNLYNLGVIPTVRVDYLFLCGNSSKLSVVESLSKEYLRNRVEKEIILDFDSVKKGVVIGATTYYTSNSDYELNKLSSLSFYLGSNIDGIFDILKSKDGFAQRGLALTENHIIFKTKTRRINNNFEEILYSYNGIISNIATDKINIINNTEMSKACIINIPKELNNKEIFVYLYLDKNIPKVKYQIFSKGADDSFRCHTENYLFLNF